MKSLLILFFSTLVLLGCELQTFGSSQFELQWERPVERENGDQLFLHELGGYEIAYRRIGERRFFSKVILDGQATSALVTQVRPGRYEVKIAAFDQNGLYSYFSESATVLAP